MDYNVELENDSMSSFQVEFPGPKDSPYEKGVWLVHVELPEAYPYKSPSIGFLNKIFHPNIDENSGSVCLDVINQTWSPMFDLVNIFETFLPQLLLYPNPTDPLNCRAAALHMRDAKAYEEAVREHVAKHATPEDVRKIRGKQPGGAMGTGTAEPQDHSRDGEEAAGSDDDEDDFLSESSDEDDGVEL